MERQVRTCKYLEVFRCYCTFWCKTLSLSRKCAVAPTFYVLGDLFFWRSQLCAGTVKSDQETERFFLIKKINKLGALGGVKNLRVTNPTMTSLTVDWEPADGAVRLYKVFFVPVAGGREEMVSLSHLFHLSTHINEAVMRITIKMTFFL